MIDPYDDYDNDLDMWPDDDYDYYEEDPYGAYN